MLYISYKKLYIIIYFNKALVIILINYFFTKKIVNKTDLNTIITNYINNKLINFFIKYLKYYYNRKSSLYITILL